MNTAPRTRYPVQTVHPSNTLMEAAGLMCTQGTSAIVVVDPENGAPLYTITDRDFVYATVEAIDARTTTLAELVRHPSFCGTAECWFG